MTANTLVIDTSYGSAVGVVGHEPIVESDSRTHVERLQCNIDRAVADAGLASDDIDRIIVGTGPAPFTGLRAGIVTAKALAYATGARLIGQDVLAPQRMVTRLEHGQADPPPERRREPHGPERGSGDLRHVTLAVNDARRRQLYFALYDETEEPDRGPLIAMDIDYPDRIVERVNAALARLREGTPDGRVVVDVVGHGADRYATAWDGLDGPGAVADMTLLDLGAAGLGAFAAYAVEHSAAEPERPVEPLYLRRPDVSVPKPLKQVLHHAGAERVDR